MLCGHLVSVMWNGKIILPFVNPNKCKRLAWNLFKLARITFAAGRPTGGVPSTTASSREGGRRGESEPDGRCNPSMVLKEEFVLHNMISIKVSGRHIIHRRAW